MGQAAAAEPVAPGAPAAAAEGRGPSFEIGVGAALIPGTSGPEAYEALFPVGGLTGLGLDLAVAWRLRPWLGLEGAVLVRVPRTTLIAARTRLDFSQRPRASIAAGLAYGTHEELEEGGAEREFGGSLWLTGALSFGRRWRIYLGIAQAVYHARCYRWPGIEEPSDGEPCSSEPHAMVNIGLVRHFDLPR